MNGKTRGIILALLITAPAALLAAEVGQPAPDFSLPSLLSRQGLQMQPGAQAHPIRLAAVRDELQRNGFEVLSVNVDTLVDDGRHGLAAAPVGHPVASDLLQIAAEAYGVDALPAGVLMDADRLVRGNLQDRAAADIGPLRQALVPLMSPGQAASIR